MGLFPGVNQPGRGDDHQFPPSTEVWVFIAGNRVNFTFSPLPLLFMFTTLHFNSTLQRYITYIGTKFLSLTKMYRNSTEDLQ
jgi:hypothetical protein